MKQIVNTFCRCHPTKASHLALPASPLLFHNPWYCLRIGIYAADSDPFHFINPSNSNHTSPQCPILYLTRPSPCPSHQDSLPPFLFLKTNINGFIIVGFINFEHLSKYAQTPSGSICTLKHLWEAMSWLSLPPGKVSTQLTEPTVNCVLPATSQTNKTLCQ